MSSSTIDDIESMWAWPLNRHILDAMPMAETEEEDSMKPSAEAITSGCFARWTETSFFCWPSTHRNRPAPGWLAPEELTLGDDGWPAAGASGTAEHGAATTSNGTSSIGADDPSPSATTPVWEMEEKIRDSSESSASEKSATPGERCEMLTPELDTREDKTEGNGNEDEGARRPCDLKGDGENESRVDMTEWTNTPNLGSCPKRDTTFVTGDTVSRGSIPIAAGGVPSDGSSLDYC